MDTVFHSWLERQHAEGLALSEASDVLVLEPEPGRRPAQRFIASFDASTMVRSGDLVTRSQGFVVVLQFPDDYLRAVDPWRIVGVLEPGDVYHPNVQPPFICTGRIAPGTGLIELLLRVWELLTYQRLTPREDDALNREACAWARQNMHLFPLTTAPLRRRRPTFSIQEIAPRAAAPEAHG